MLHVVIMLVQGLSFRICIAPPLELYTCIFLANGRGESSVKIAITALLKDICEHSFVPISLLSDKVSRGRIQPSWTGSACAYCGTKHSDYQVEGQRDSKYSAL